MKVRIELTRFLRCSRRRLRWHSLLLILVHKDCTDDRGVNDTLGT